MVKSGQVLQTEDKPVMLYTIRISSRSWFQIGIYFDLPKVIWGQTKVKLWLNPPNWSKYIKYTYDSTQNFLKNSNSIFFKVNWGHQKSNLGQTRQMGVKSGGLVEIYSIYIFFDSKFSQELKFNIFQGRLGSSEVMVFINLANTLTRNKWGSVVRADLATKTPYHQILS